MSTDLYLGIDVGTSVTKGTVLSSKGDVLSQRFSSNKYGSSIFDGNEHDPETVWWQEFLRIAKDLVSDVGPECKVSSIAVTGMIPNITPISSSGLHLHNGILFYDGRAYDLELQLDNELGTPKWQNEVLSKLIWLKAKLGDRWQDVNTILSTHSYIVYRLTGEVSTDTVTALESGNIYSGNNNSWNSELLSKYDIESALFPRIRAPKEIVGFLTQEASELLGLTPGIPVVTGTSDTISTILGAGLRLKGEMLIYYGTYNSCALLTDDIGDVLNGRINRNPLKWTVTIPRSGQQISRLASQFFPSSDVYVSLNQLDNEATKSKPGSNGVLFIQTLDLPTSTVSTEPKAGLINIRIDNDLSDICRSLLEAFGYGMRYSFEVLNTHPNPSQCYAAGGGARSPIWKQIISDITGLEQIYLPAADRGVGSAILAGLAVNPVFKEQVEEKLMNTAVVVKPDQRNNRIYEERYREYRDFLNNYNS